MKRVLSILSVAIVLFCSMPLENVFATSVDDVASLETIESASASALFETIKRLGYSFTEIPGNATDSFMNIMRPLVDSLVNDGYRLEDAFGRVGNRLYYSAEKLVEWVKHLFGSGNEGQYAVNSSSTTVSQSAYNSTLARWSGYTDYGAMNGYPLLIAGYQYNSVTNPIIPIFYIGNTRYRTRGLYFQVSYSVSNGVYSFVGWHPFSYSSYYLNENNQWVSHGSSSSTSVFLVYPESNASSYDLNLNQSFSASSLEEAFKKYYDFCATRVINYTLWLKFNGNDYYINPQGYKITRPSAPSVQPSGYYPVDYDYVVNNFNDGDTIYENNVVNNNTTNNNTTNINPVFDIDFEDTFDFGLPDILDNINELPGYLTRSAIGISNHVGGDSPGGGLMGTIFNGMPIEISTVLIACFVLLCVFGLLNRLLG